MILVDANILLYAYHSDSPRHQAARGWFETELSSGRPVGFTLVTLLAFVRIASDRRVFDRPLSPSAACSLIEEWLDQPNARLVHPGPRTWRALAELCEAGQARGPMVMDAHLAAVAIEHGAAVATSDRDFTRFPGVRLVDPATGDSLHEGPAGALRRSWISDRR